MKISYNLKKLNYSRITYIFSLTVLFFSYGCNDDYEDLIQANFNDLCKELNIKMSDKKNILFAKTKDPM